LGSDQVSLKITTRRDHLPLLAERHPVNAQVQIDVDIDFIHIEHWMFLAALV